MEILGDDYHFEICNLNFAFGNAVYKLQNCHDF